MEEISQKSKKPIELLKESSVDKQILNQEFINYIPRRLDIVVREGFHEIEELADCLDCIDFHYRHFLKGHAKTLRRVFYEFRRLPKDYLFEGLDVIYEIDNILNVNELYEMKDRHEKAKSRIQKMLLKLNRDHK